MNHGIHTFRLARIGLASVSIGVTFVATILSAEQTPGFSTGEAINTVGGICQQCGCNKLECCCAEPKCCPVRTVEKEKKSCWQVASEYVCIPRFRFPWECCDCPASCRCKDCCPGPTGSRGPCGPLCGRVRCVNVLEAHEYECEKCGFQWEVKCVRTTRGSRSGPCNCPNCGDLSE